MRGPIAGFRGHVVTALVATAIAVAFLLAFVGVGGGLPRTSQPYELRALVPTASSLTTGSRVTMAGVKVGTVTEVRRQGLGALVSMELTDERVTPVPEDSVVRMRARTAVGENYVSIDPGRSRTTLASGHVLPLRQAAEYVDVDQIASVLQGRTRAQARKIVRGLGYALDRRGERVNGLVAGASRALGTGSHVVETLAGERRQISRLIAQLGDLTAAVGDRGDAIRLLARQGRTAFTAVARRDDAVRRILDELPPTLDRVRRTTRTVADVADRATPVVENLTRAVTEVRPVVAALRPAAQEGRSILREVDTAAGPLTGTLAALERAAGPATKALPQVDQVLCQVNPMLRYAKPYTQDVISALVGLGSASNAYDAIGHTIRLVPVITDNTLVGLPRDVSKFLYSAIHEGLLEKLLPLNWNPYPKPGEQGQPYRGKGIHGPRELRESGFVYPRIHEDC
ncbi:MlaD family protein [Patulibacter defluvii]|uniref:MlaD family protein n=1 Tax=Patulibacter defluvii TaxID=3095358 RepID=UPI002A76698F|nr:MlaD family protein [Patulibacter sp. DM4]